MKKLHHKMKIQRFNSQKVQTGDLMSQNFDCSSLYLNNEDDSINLRDFLWNQRKRKINKIYSVIFTGIVEIKGLPKEEEE